MTDDRLDPLDELASAYLDNEVTPDERARVESDAELRARVDRLRRVSTAVGEPIHIDAAERERVIAAALSIATTMTPGDQTDRPGAATGVTDEVAARRQARDRRHERNRRIGGWLGAVAAIGVVGLVVSRLGGTDRDDATSSDTVAAVESAADETIGAIDGGAEVATTGGPAAKDASAAESTAAAAAGDDTAALSQVAVAFTTDQELIDYVRESRTNRSIPAPAAGGAVSAMATCPLPAGTPGETVGPAAWQGTPGVLVLVPSAAAPTEAVIVSADCATVLVRVPVG